MPHNDFKIPEAFKVRFNGIDAEHEEIVSLLNQYCRECNGGRQEDFEHAFERIISHVRDHFAHEEQHMRDTRYPGYEWHRDHHDASVQQLEKVREACRQRGYADAATFVRLYKDVIEDVARADLKFREYLLAEGLLED